MRMPKKVLVVTSLCMAILAAQTFAQKEDHEKGRKANEPQSAAQRYF